MTHEPPACLVQLWTKQALPIPVTAEIYSPKFISRQYFCPQVVSLSRSLSCDNCRRICKAEKTFPKIAVPVQSGQVEERRDWSRASTALGGQVMSCRPGRSSGRSSTAMRMRSWGWPCSNRGPQRAALWLISQRRKG